MRRIAPFILALATLLLAACGAGGFSQQATSEQYQVRLTLDATTTGRRVAEIELRDRQGQPVVAESVLLAPAMGGMGHSLPELAAAPEAPGRYRAAGELFSMRGPWLVTVAVRRGGASESVRFSVDVSS